MIKRLLFGAHAGAPAEFADAWLAAQSAALAAPMEVRPVRIEVCTALDEITPEPPHDGIALHWFSDEEHLRRFEAWQPAAAPGRLTPAADLAAVTVVVAREKVLRGADWLRRRRRDGGTSLKHLALARRVPGLTQQEFFDRWQSRAGSVGTVPIPPEARGAAYVQNHPLPRADSDWPYDAVNEVYFDDLAGLRTRISWFAANLGDNEDDLFQEPRFIAVREETLWPQGTPL
jgi:hypothetical protein